MRGMMEFSFGNRFVTHGYALYEHALYVSTRAAQIIAN